MSDETKPPEAPAPGEKPPTEDNSALKKALDQERQARKELERLIKEKERTESEAKASAEKAELERKGEWEKLKATVEAEKIALAKERDEAQHHFKTHLVKSELTAAIAAHKGDPLLMKLVEDQFEAVLSPDGHHRVITKGGDNKTPALLIEGLKKDTAYGRFFEGSGVTGGGAPPIGGSHAAPDSNLSPVERMKAARKAS
jgi:hypothetical protein